MTLAEFRQALMTRAQSASNCAHNAEQPHAALMFRTQEALYRNIADQLRLIEPAKG